MPIYDYHCDHCGHTFSAVQSYTDATLEICPSCAKKPRKLMATPAIVFKGGGWYKTDSRVAPKDGADAANAGGAGKSDAPDKPAKQDKDKQDRPDKKAAPVASTDGPKTDGAKATDTSTAKKPAPAAGKGETASS